jgi:hypothetical protein
MPQPDRADKLRRDPNHLEAVLKKFDRLVRRRVEQRAFAKITLVITDGVPVDILEERRAHVEESAVDSW